jgi:hypothetical protein
MPADAKASAASAPTRAVFGPASFSRTPEASEAGVHTGRPTRAPKRGPARVSADKIVQAFNTWAFKREQPDTPELLTRAVARHLDLSRPLSFVLYWGKGPRDTISAPDRACLDYLGAMSERVRAAYQPGASFKLIFTDTHAGLNGHSEVRMNDYFGAIEVAARERGFKTCRLGELVRAARAAGIAPDDSAAMTDETKARLRGCAAKWFRRAGCRGLLRDEHDGEAGGRIRLPEFRFRHVQRQRVPRSVSGADADLLHVFGAPGRRREALVHAGLRRNRSRRAVAQSCGLDRPGVRP